MGPIHDRKVVPLTGPLTMAQADSTRETLLAALECGATALVIDCADATDADISLLQLLISASLSAERRGMSFAVTCPPDGVVARTARAAGLAGGGIFSDKNFRAEGF